MNNINLFSITHSVDYCLIVDLEYEDEVEGMTRAKYAYRASEPYGFSPYIDKWIAENNLTIMIYIPPETETEPEPIIVIPAVTF